MRYAAPIDSLELEVDIRLVPPQQRTEDLLRMFDALARGEGLVFVDDREPATLLAALQQRYGGELDWYPLEMREDLWRVLVARRATRLSSLRRVVQFMTSDHRRMEQMLLRVRELASMGAWEEAARLSQFLETGMRRHMQMEERVLFPLLAELDHESGGSLPEIEQDHRRMLDLLGRIQDLAEDAQLGTVSTWTVEDQMARLASALLRLFFAHEAREDRLLYARTDLIVGPAGTDELVRGLQRLR